MDVNGLTIEQNMDLDHSRGRSSTWPLPDPTLAEEGEVKREESESPVPTSSKAEPQKKMRNAWGDMSYADLITRAILSAPEKRLTLSEIYEWIVQNVPYFADKAASPSTAGWKVSSRMECGRWVLLHWQLVCLLLGGMSALL